MNVADVGDLSIGEWIAICRRWNLAHGTEKATPPTEEEFDLAVMQARGAA